MNGVARECPRHTSCEGIFRRSHGNYITSFASYYHIDESLYVELIKTISLIEIIINH